MDVNEVPAKPRNLTVQQGASWRRTLTYKDSSGNPIDITGYSIHGEIREKKTRDSRLLAIMTMTIVDAPNGKFTAEMTSEQTAQIDRSGYYDITLSSSDTVRISQGRILLDTEVTAAI